MLTPVITPLVITGVATGVVPVPRSPLKDTVVPAPYPLPPEPITMLDRTLVVVAVATALAS